MKAMKYLNLILVILSFNQVIFCQLSINYFNQDPPGKIPVKFAEGFISKPDIEEICPIFSPDGKEFYYTELDDQNWSYFKVMVSKYIDGGWTAPVEVYLPGEEFEVGCCFSPDGNTMYFSSCSGDWDIDIYKMDRDSDGWGPAEKLSQNINSFGSAIATSVSGDSVMYFRSSEGDWNSGKMNVYFSELNDNGYDTAIKISYPVSTGNKEDYPTIAPDGSYLFLYRGISNTSNSAQILISFKKDENEWTNPKNTGLNINARQPGFTSITPDTNYLLFQGYDKDIYWVELKSLVDSLRDSNYEPYVLNSLRDTSILAGTEFNFTLPESVFYDDDETETLTISATQSDNSALPGSLEFYPSTNTFSGIISEAGYYSIKITATDISGASVSDIFTLTVEGSEAFNTGTISNEITVYPNPAFNTLQIEYPALSEKIVHYDINNLSGITIQKGVITGNTIDVSMLNKGMYLLNIISENKRTSIKIFIQ